MPTTQHGKQRSVLQKKRGARLLLQGRLLNGWDGIRGQQTNREIHIPGEKRGREKALKGRDVREDWVKSSLR